jgi:hypothetical protein
MFLLCVPCVSVVQRLFQAHPEQATHAALYVDGEQYSRGNNFPCGGWFPLPY